MKNVFKFRLYVQTRYTCETRNRQQHQERERSSNDCECDYAGNAIAIVSPILHTLIIHILPSVGFVVIATSAASESRPSSPDSLYPQITRSLGLLL